MRIKNKLAVCFTTITLVIILAVLPSYCGKQDHLFSFCISPDDIPDENYFHCTDGYANLGQYFGIPGGSLHSGCSCGYSDNYKGLPKGEFVAFYHVYERDEKKML